MSRLLTQVSAGPYTVRGVSVGGIYTSLQVPEMGVIFDAGLPLRSFAGTDVWLFSHGHADHLGALPALLGIRGMMHKGAPRVFLPAEILDPVQDVLRCMSRLQRFDLQIEAVPMNPGDERQLRTDLWVRAFRTHHPVPSLGYQLFRKVQKLRPEFAHLPGPEIGALRKQGRDIFHDAEHLELAYATDTLVHVLDTQPSLLQSRVLVLECTFLDERKPLAASRAGCHIHLDELLRYADRLRNQHIVLMHFSQIYQPAQIPGLLAERCPPDFLKRIIPFAPARGTWPG